MGVKEKELMTWQPISRKVALVTRTNAREVNLQELLNTEQVEVDKKHSIVENLTTVADMHNILFKHLLSNNEAEKTSLIEHYMQIKKELIDRTESRKDAEEPIE